jgi:hypothetical protein
MDWIEVNIKLLSPLYNRHKSFLRQYVPLRPWADLQSAELLFEFPLSPAHYLYSYETAPCVTYGFSLQQIQHSLLCFRI